MNGQPTPDEPDVTTVAPAVDVDTEAAWETANAEFLGAALRWLRLRLEQLAPPSAPAARAPAPIAAPAPPSATEGRRRLRRRGQGPAPTRPIAELPAVTPSDRRPTDDDVTEARRALERASSGEQTPALRILGERLGLSTFEQELLLLCAGMELDPGLAAACAQANDDPRRPYPTFALAMTMFDDAAWSVLSPERPLRLWRLVEINQPSGEPLTSSGLRADERIVSFIKGLNYLDDRLTPLLMPLDAVVRAGAELPPSQHDVADLVARHLGEQTRLPGASTVQLVGADAVSRQLVARHVAEAGGLHLFRLPIELLPKDPADLTALARLWERESALLPVALYLDADAADRTSGEQADREARVSLQQFLGRSGGVFLVGTREVMPQLGSSCPSVDVAKPLPTEQRDAWEQGPAAVPPDDADVLAGQFNLDVATIAAVARLVPSEGPPDGERRNGEGEDPIEPMRDRIWRACLDATRPRLDLLAQRIEPKSGWDDIVLEEDALRLLHEIGDQVRARARVYDDWGFRRRMSRGLGISALFAGESGTGKTMAAEVLAADLRLNLYRIDLSAVVSKYIGETEKNLRQLFDAAEDGGAILFFDEADALFGKRSEVKDSHDRYANIEVNYLLQRMEAFEGLAILATNQRRALDRAFLRRLRFVVTFPVPGAEQRSEIWRHVFPSETPLADLDFDRLGRLALTGGNIHNVALNAAFAAARQGGAVTMPIVLDAARAEFEKIDKPVNESDFRWETPAAVGDPTPQEVA